MQVEGVIRIVRGQLYNGRVGRSSREATSSNMTARLGLDGVWSVPPSGYLKCNVETALFSNNEKVGFGVVVPFAWESLLKHIPPF